MKCQVSLPYIKEWSEEFHRTFKALGFGTYFKLKNISRQVLVARKHPEKKEDKCGVAYLINCGREKEGEECKSSFIGGNSTTRAAEHQQPSSSSSEVAYHLHLTGRHHNHVSLNKINILDSELVWHKRGVKEVVYGTTIVEEYPFLESFHTIHKSI